MQSGAFWDTLCTDLVSSGWFFWYSQFYTVMITIFFFGRGKLLPLKYPRWNPTNVFLWIQQQWWPDGLSVWRVHHQHVTLLHTGSGTPVEPVQPRFDHSRAPWRGSGRPIAPAIRNRSFPRKCRSACTRGTWRWRSGICEARGHLLWAVRSG